MRSISAGGAAGLRKSGSNRRISEIAFAVKFPITLAIESGVQKAITKIADRIPQALPTLKRY
jgi:hypothetical protein